VSHVSTSYFAPTNSSLSGNGRALWRERKPPSYPGPLHTRTCSEKGRSPGPKPEPAGSEAQWQKVLKGFKKGLKRF
jgi:hypothetical protein